MLLGISQDFIRSCFKHVAETYLPGNSLKQKCDDLFKLKQTFYKDTATEDRLNTLTPGMLQKEKQKKGKKAWPKLRAKAGETRALIPFCKQLVERYRVGLLKSRHECIHENLWQQQLLQARARGFAMLSVHLTSLPEQKLFRAKSKLHAFLECAGSPVNPSKVWSYRNESFGHTMSKYAVRRGGEFTMLGVSRAMLQKFAANNPKPPLLRP